jgi:dTDP-4-dehydrorhamnose reductase
MTAPPFGQPNRLSRLHLKVLLTGKNGQVGFELARHLADTHHELVSVGSADCDLSKPAAIRDLIQTVKPDVLINPAAYTAVDRAESERDLAKAINADAPEVMAGELKKTGGLLIHFSTDYVFDGQKASPYNELDAPNPQSVYGQTKLLGEQAITASGVAHIILRTSWVFGSHGHNFLKTMLRLAAEREELGVVNDQFGTPTSARFLAHTVTQMLGRLGPEKAGNQEAADRAALTGLYHCSCSGRTSWYDYAEFAIELARNNGAKLKLQPSNLIPIPFSAYPTPAARPANSVLDNTKLEQTFGIQRPDWQSEVEQVIQALNWQP